MRTILDIAALQIAWWVTALGAASGLWWPGVAACAAVIAVQLALADDRRKLGLMVMVAGGLGIVTETALAAMGILTYAAASPAIGLAPLWLVALWLMFGTSITPFRSALGPRALPIAAVLGAISGPLTYWAGQRLGALELAQPQYGSLAVIAVVWALTMAVLVAVDARQTGSPPA